MQILSNPFMSSGGSRSRRSQSRHDGAVTTKKNVKTVKFGGSSRRTWRIKVARRMRFRKVILSPLKIWSKLKNKYMNMMLNLEGNVGHLNNGNVFGGKRIPQRRQVSDAYTSNEFDNRLLFEIYKALASSSSSS